MNKNEIVEILCRSANENGLVPTLNEVFGKNISIRVPFYAPSCSVSIDELEFSVRSSNAMKRAGLMTVGQVIDALHDDSMKRIRNLGRKSYIEIQTKILQYGYDNLPDKEKRNFFFFLLDRNTIG